jgi:peptidoglycan hydrolase CwlO-like protein
MMKHSYKRDPSTNILINNDEKEYKEHQFKTDVVNKISNLQNEVKYLKTEVQILSKQFMKIQEKFKDV